MILKDFEIFELDGYEYYFNVWTYDYENGHQKILKVAFGKNFNEVKDEFKDYLDCVLKTVVIEENNVYFKI